jgi:hypothetical protein
MALSRVHGKRGGKNGEQRQSKYDNRERRLIGRKKSVRKTTKNKTG